MCVFEPSGCGRTVYHEGASGYLISTVWFVRTINSFSSSDAHNTATQVQSPWMTERAVTASKRTTPRHQSALQLAEHSTFYNVLTTTTSTSIKAHIEALSLA